jgi:hypothetical protein
MAACEVHVNREPQACSVLSSELLQACKAVQASACTIDIMWHARACRTNRLLSVFALPDHTRQAGYMYVNVTCSGHLNGHMDCTV